MLVKNHLDDAVAFVHQVEQRAITLLAGPHRIFGAQALHSRPDACSQLTGQLDLVLTPGVRLGLVQAECKQPLVVPEQWRADERSDPERCELRRIHSRIGHHVADDDDFAGACQAEKSFVDEVRQTIHPDQAWDVIPTPVMRNDHLFCRFADFNKGTCREVQMRADSGADCSHHFVHGRPLQQLPADRREKCQIQLRLSCVGDVARHGQQTHRGTRRIADRRHPDFPPFRFVAQCAKESGKQTFAARDRRRDRCLRLLPIGALPEVDPGRVQEWHTVGDAQQCVAVVHRQQLAIEIEHLDAIRTALDDTAAERFALRVWHPEARARLVGVFRLQRATLLREYAVVLRLVRGGCQRAEALQLAQIFGVKGPGSVMRNRPECADRLSLNVKRNQQALFSGGHRRAEGCVAPFEVLEQKWRVQIEYITARTELARRADPDVRRPRAGDCWREDVLRVGGQQAHACGVGVEHVENRLGQLLQNRLRRVSHCLSQRQQRVRLFHEVGRSRGTAL